MKIFLLLLLTLFTANVNANLLISPTNAFFLDRDRVKEIIIINTSDTTNTYRISSHDKQQTFTGSYQNLDGKLSDFSAQPYLRFSPKQVRLKPGERQIVKVVARNKSELSNGDYRSHLTFTALLSQDDNNSDESGKIKVNLMFNYSIPIVIRKGESNISIQSSEAIMKQTTIEGLNRTEIELVLSRQGDNGTIGKLEIIAENAAGKEEVVGYLNNASIFRESESRSFVINISEPKLLDNADKVKIVFTDVATRSVYLESFVNLRKEY